MSLSSYITLDQDDLGQALHSQRYVILCDDNTSQYIPYLTDIIGHAAIETIVVAAGEKSKSISTSAYIWSTLQDHNIQRTDTLIALGGGMITDLGGWIATSYHRGMGLVLAPTSLLGMVDAAVGGKNGINLKGLKNQVGTFRLPRLLYLNQYFLTTLNDREWLAGYAEMIKHALIDGPPAWDVLKNYNHPRSQLTQEDILYSIQIKDQIVQGDSLESGLRKVLNLGHTAGHAMESFFIDTESPLLHGEAVAYGLMVELDLSVQLLGLSQSICDDIKTYIRSIFTLPALAPDSWNDLRTYLKGDKKNKDQSIRAALLSELGKPVYDVIVTEEQWKLALERYST